MNYYIIFSLMALMINVQQIYSMKLISIQSNSFIRNKLIDKNKEFSIADWKKYKSSLREMRKITHNPRERKNLAEAIQDVKKIIIENKIQELYLDLTAMSTYIRRSQTTSNPADLEELLVYQIKLSNYISLLPPSHPQREKRQNELYVVIERRSLLIEIDTYLQKDYETFDKETLEFLVSYLPELQKKLNKPNSPRHKPLQEKIELVQELIKM